MDLILWRHAEAEEGEATTPDHKRRLTARGEMQAKQMARWLHQHLPRKRKVLVSPAERTQQTAHALELPYEIEPKLGIGASATDVLKAAGWPDHNGAVLIIGHQPTLGRVAALLLGGEEADWTVKKGGVWWFASRMRNDEAQTVLRAVLNPDLAST
ncbi:MAG: histidine phosphatase family protein [Rhodocyclales bacterium RIFCSPLOWO2_02_FULL_63_24]|nr:MAG: histidine phosphatase family protein [Rhodocyclales bacterium RIFCSPLOWO2_02_FULL_63_24]